MFRIGAFARLGGVSAKQLRAYDALGLFRPVWVDPSSGYRFYSPAQLPDLRRIVAMRQLGMPLEEIGRVVTGGDLRETLARRRAELERERRLAEERLAALDISVEEESGADIVVRPIGTEPVAVARVTSPVNTAFDRLEAYVRDQGRRAHRPPGAIPERREIFVPLTGPIASTEAVEYRRLPAARVASVIHRGPYSGMADARRALRRWVEAADLAPRGPMRTLYLQFGADPGLGLPAGWTVDRGELFVTELQLPVG